MPRAPSLPLDMLRLPAQTVSPREVCCALAMLQTTPASLFYAQRPPTSQPSPPPPVFFLHNFSY